MGWWTDAGCSQGCFGARVQQDAYNTSPVQVVEEAQRRWQAEEEGVADDITVVVVFFNHTSL